MSRDKRTSVSTASTAENNSSKKYIFREQSSVNKLLTNKHSNSSVYAALTDEFPRVPLGFRVKVSVYNVYSKLPRKLKRLVRDILEQTILNISKAEIREAEKQIIVNIPVNIAVQKTEVKNIAMDPEVLVERINTLKIENRELKDIIRVHKRRIQELEAENRELLKTKKKYLELLEHAKMWLTWLKKGYTNYVIKEIEKVIK